MAHAANKPCSCIITSEGMHIPWCDTCRYLGVYLTCATIILLILTTPNLILTGLSTASWPRSVAQHHMMLWFSCFVPSVCHYGTEACNPTNKVVKSLDYVITYAFSTIFSCNNPKVIRDCKLAFGFDKMSDIITARREGFLSGLTKSSDLFKYLSNFLI